MKKIIVMSQKGGAGKTTATVNLSVAASMAGHAVALIDLDPQASATRWSDNRTGDAPVVISAHAVRLSEILHAAEADGISLVIIDTPPSKDPDLVDVARNAELALIPCRPSGFDLDAIRSTINVGTMARVPMRVLFNAVRSQGSRFYAAKKAVSIYGVESFPCYLGNRVAFEDSILNGQSVLEYEPTGKAAREVNVLYNQIMNVMEV